MDSPLLAKLEEGEAAQCLLLNMLCPAAGQCCPHQRQGSLGSLPSTSERLELLQMDAWLNWNLLSLWTLTFKQRDGLVFLLNSVHISNQKARPQ